MLPSLSDIYFLTQTHSTDSMQSLKDVISGGMPAPKYLSGDKAGIDAFVDKFDVFLFDCDGVLPPTAHSSRQLLPTDTDLHEG